MERILHFAKKFEDDYVLEQQLAIKKENRDFILKGFEIKDVENYELGEMRKDIFENRNNFEEKRRDFVLKL